LPVYAISCSSIREMSLHNRMKPNTAPQHNGKENIKFQ